MTSNVTILPCDTTLDLPAERILQSALTKDLEACCVIGVDNEGEFYMATTTGDIGQILLWIERAKLLILTGGSHGGCE